jgi:hypothetical protein
MRLVSAALLIALLCISKTHADDVRTWTDATGQFKIEAKFIKLEKNIVTLERADGTRVEIELSKLKQEDQLEASRQLGMQQGRNARPADGRIAALPPTAIDWTVAKPLTVTEGLWNPPAILNPEQKLDFTPKPITFERNDIFAQVTGMVVHPKQRRAYVVTSTSHPQARNAVSSTFHVCDLEKGQVTKKVDAFGVQTPVAISDDGTLLLTREDSTSKVLKSSGNSQMVTLWKVHEHAITPIQRWDASPENDWHSHVTGARFLRDGTLLTWLANGQFTWWDLATMKPKQTLHMEINFTPAFSSDSRIMAGLWYKRPEKPQRPPGEAPPPVLFPGHYNNLVLIDTATGATLSSLRLDYTHVSSLGFSPEGKHIAVLSYHGAYVYELKTGTLESKIPFHGSTSDTSCHWTSASTLMTTNPICFLAPEYHANIWKYQLFTRNNIVGFKADHLFYLTDMNVVKLQALKLPHPKALELVEKIKNDPQGFVLKPGTKVKIDLRGFAPGKYQTDVLAALRKQIKVAGLEEGEGGVSLLAWYAEQGERQLFYTQDPAAPFRKTSDLRVKAWTYQARIESQGDIHWSAVGRSMPTPLLHLKLDEKITDYVKMLNEPELLFYQNLTLPRYLLRDMKAKLVNVKDPKSAEVSLISLKWSRLDENGIDTRGEK